MARTTLLAGVTAALSAVPLLVPAPVAAVTLGEFHGDAILPCFGCGRRDDGTFHGTFTGVIGDEPVAGAPMGASFSYEEPVCPVLGNASGTAVVVDVAQVDFTWTRVGAHAVITFSGDVSGNGVATFVVTSPAGNPCGQPVTAIVAGTVVGA